MHLKTLTLILALTILTPAAHQQLSALKLACDFTDAEREFMQIWSKDKRQRRKNPRCHPMLLELARERAKDMAVRNYFSHTNPDGYGPNYLLQKKGYKLPKYWGNKPKANFIESVAGGNPTGKAAYDGWMKSPMHKQHVLGTKKFYGDQPIMAVGHYYSASSRYKHYWVFLSAPAEP